MNIKYSSIIIITIWLTNLFLIVRGTYFKTDENELD